MNEATCNKCLCLCQHKYIWGYPNSKREGESLLPLAHLGGISVYYYPTVTILCKRCLVTLLGPEITPKMECGHPDSHGSSVFALHLSLCQLWMFQKLKTLVNLKYAASRYIVLQLLTLEQVWVTFFKTLVKLLGDSLFSEFLKSYC